ncbi:MAG: response regulator [Lachnospiraceae bacterium]|nr:response regulator [Lachnospiraceae bacterium]
MWKVMIADDENYINDALQTLVPWGKMGCELVYCAKNGHELIEHIDEKKPDIVITDIRMPLVDGLQVAKYVYENLKTTCVIILSAYSDFEYAQEAMRYDVGDYVVKTAMIEDIPIAVKRAIEKLTRYKKRDGEAAEEQPEDILGKVQAYIQQNYMKKITLTDIAEEVHANRSYLSRLYKNKTGKNMFDVINIMKLEKAKEYIGRGKKIYETAELVGFDDVAYFSRVFKKYEGYTPKEYDKNCR